jgi:hypothetical protein
MKAYTDLEQSKKLAEILPLGSADMWYEDSGLMIPRLGHMPKEHSDTEVPCWSLATLYSILPNNKKESTILSRGGWNIEPIDYIDNWWCEYEDDNHDNDFTVSADNPVDACVNMIVKLHEQNII